MANIVLAHILKSKHEATKTTHHIYHITFIYIYTRIKVFNKLPTELSGDFGQARYFKLATDSQYIYVIGDIKQNIQGDILPILGIFDYSGTLIKKSI